MYYRLLFLSLFTLSVACSTKTETIPTLTISHDANAIATYEVLENGILQVRYDGEEPSDPITSRSVLASPILKEDWVVTKKDGMTSYRKGEWTLITKDGEHSLKFEYQNTPLFTEASAITHRTDSIEYTTVSIKTSAEEQFFGAGPRAVPQNLRGRVLEIYNQPHYGYANGTPNLNITLPWVISSMGYGIYFDSENPAILDLASTTPSQWQYEVESTTDLTYYILPGSLQELPSRYTQLTGTQPLPPRWALGFIQSRYGYETEAQAREVVSGLQTAGFPLDGLVLDLQWFGDKERMGDLDWDRERFPTPEKMISDFRDTGVKLINIMEPYFTRESANFNYLDSEGWMAKSASDSTYIIEDFWTGGGGAGLLDLYNPQPIDWFWSFFKARTLEGVEGWWCDLGEPENHPEGMMHAIGPARQAHNGYSLIWAEMLYRKFKEDFPEKRLFNLIRSGFGGMQRYSTFPWSGDISRSWSGYQAQIPVMLGAGLSGIGYMSSDLGGFTGGEQNDELYTRWLQFGAFTPIMRAHGAGGIPAEPIYYSQQTQSIVREYIKLRYSLLPYNYTLAWENSTLGTPLVRPVWFQDPSSLDSYHREDQYFWGDSFLVAPIMEASQMEREVYFPKGVWYSWYDDTQYEGSRTTTVPGPLDQMPLFVKAGSIIPRVTQEMLSTDVYATSILQLEVFPTLDGSPFSGHMYHDDGKNPNAVSEGAYEQMTWAVSYEGNTQTIKFDRGHTWEKAPTERTLIMKIRNQSPPSEGVVWGEEELPQVDQSLSENGYFYDGSSKQLWVKVTWEHSTRSLFVK